MKMIFSNIAGSNEAGNNRFMMYSKSLFIFVFLLLPATVLWAEKAAPKTESKSAREQSMVKSSGQELMASPVEQSPAPVSNVDSGWQLSAEQWELARSGATILSLPVLKSVLKSWLKDRQNKIQIRYPGGEDGELWVQELTDWLVSLGVPSKKLVTNAGSGADDVIKFNIINTQ